MFMHKNRSSPQILCFSLEGWWTRESKMEILLKMKPEGLKQNCNSNNILLVPGSPCLCYNPLNVLFLL